MRVVERRKGLPRNRGREACVVPARPQHIGRRDPQGAFAGGYGRHPRGRGHEIHAVAERRTIVNQIEVGRTADGNDAVQGRKARGAAVVACALRMAIRTTLPRPPRPVVAALFSALTIAGIGVAAQLFDMMAAPPLAA